MSHYPNYTVQPGAYFNNPLPLHWDPMANQHQLQRSPPYHVPAPYQSLSAYTSPASSTSASPSSASSASFSPVIPTVPVARSRTSYRAIRRNSTVTTTVQHGVGLNDLLDQDPSSKPPYPVKALAEAAIKSSATGMLTLGEICDSIIQRYPYYKDAENARKLRGSVRHDVSQDPRFIKHNRSPLHPGRGAYWAFNDNVESGKQKRSTHKSDSASHGKFGSIFSGSSRRASRSSGAIETVYVASPAPLSPTSYSPAPSATTLFAHSPNPSPYIHSRSFSNNVPDFSNYRLQ
ncbi:Forkhead box protein E1 [Tulasnella sp. 427]|nr:Forkhead box protein E1 [Tulasnella sp. 427]